jgi:probable F420-dependent oxidoreductase
MEPRRSTGSAWHHWPQHDPLYNEPQVIEDAKSPQCGGQPGFVNTNTLGLWAGFLDQLSLPDAIATAKKIEAFGIDTIWLPEWSGVEPFIRAGLYLAATDRLTVATGVANAHARDADAMVSAAGTLESSFPRRFVLGIGVSHRTVVEGRGHMFPPPLTFMRSYLDAMSLAAGSRPMPPIVLGALGPKMLQLAGSSATGAYSYFCPVAHTIAARRLLSPRSWLISSQMVSDASSEDWRDRVAHYMRLCLGMPNYTTNLKRFGFGARDFANPSDALVDSLVVADSPELLKDRIASQLQAGADHVVVQFVPPPSPLDVVTLLERNAGTLRAATKSGQASTCQGVEL